MASRKPKIAQINLKTRTFRFLSDLDSTVIAPLNQIWNIYTRVWYLFGAKNMLSLRQTECFTKYY